MSCRIQLALLLLTIGLVLTACDVDTEGECWSVCCQQVIINADEYQNAPNDVLEIVKSIQPVVKVSDIKLGLSQFDNTVNVAKV